VWRDDSQVVKAEISKRYGQNPGVHVSVYRNE
jgi:Holliday junction resolvase RusA-like endonuclease